MSDTPPEPALEGPLFAHGFSWRKRPLLRGFTARDDIRFVRAGRDVAAGASLLLWGSAEVPADLPPGVRIVRVEDGFVRSVGLGADLVRPLSWVIDDVGIYYDAGAPSRLETLLQQGGFTTTELARAAALRERIVAAGLTKYNLAAAPWQPARPDRRPVVLVPGQVETDAAIARGTVDLRTNLGLLQAVRAARPDAWVVYKPHPDVVAGLRGAGSGEDQAARHCDEVVTGGSLHDMLHHVDEVHVLTSLAGFEALLRGRAVACWGLPFYAGWGLTQDRHGCARRTRRVTLDELVAATLLRYPVYASLQDGRRCPPEQALYELQRWRARAGGVPLPWWRRLLRPLLARP